MAQVAETKVYPRMKQVLLLFALTLSLALHAQTGLKKVYDETLTPLHQIDQAVAKADSVGKRVICQVGGNWCPWCLRLADFLDRDETLRQFIVDNFIYIHVNYRPGAPSDAAKAAQDSTMLARLGDPTHFGYPVLVVLGEQGRVLHIQETGCLEKEKSYDRDKLLQFFSRWKK